MVPNGCTQPHIGLGASQTAASVPRDRRLDVADAGDLYLHHLETVKGLKPTTLTDYRTILRGHLAPFLAGRTVGRLTPEDMEVYRSASCPRA